MKKNLIVSVMAAAALLVCTPSSAATKVRKTAGKTAPATAVQTFSEAWVEDQSKFEDRKQPAHATFIPYSSSTVMMKDETFLRPWTAPRFADYMSLNGNWKFHYTPDRHKGMPLCLSGV